MPIGFQSAQDARPTCVHSCIELDRKKCVSRLCLVRRTRHVLSRVPRCTLRCRCACAPRPRSHTGRTRRISHLMRVQELAETDRTAEPGQRCRCQNTNTQDYREHSRLQFLVLFRRPHTRPSPAPPRHRERHELPRATRKGAVEGGAEQAEPALMKPFFFCLSDCLDCLC